MSQQPLTGVPRQIEAGNYVAFTLTPPDYPASTWAGSFVLSTGTLLPVATAATPQGDSFLVTLTSSVTAQLAAATWEWAFYATQSSQRYTACNGVMTVLPNLSVQSAPSTAQALLTLLETAITKLAANPNQSVNFNGQSFTKRDMKSLLEQRVQLQAEVYRQQAALARQRGGRDPNRIAIEFLPQTDSHLRYDQGFPYDLGR